MGRHITYITLILSWAWVANAHAQQVATTITRTAGAGDLGTKVSRAGNSFDINGGTRPSNGRNLFHSFDQFSLGSGDTANFVNDTNLATENILSRVTGGSRSDIFGTIKTTRFPGADLFLLNPHGIVFGPSARLDVQGSFHASTGNFIRLSDRVRFDATPSSSDALLSTASPAAFGFLGDHPAKMAFQESKLKVLEGKTLSVVGGDIAITEKSLLQAPGGRVNVASVASAGEVTLGRAELGTGSFARLGKIDMMQGSIIDVSEAKGRATGGGRVLIRGGRLVMEEKSKVSADTKNGAGKSIDVKLTDALVMKNGSEIHTNTIGAKKGGDLQVKAQDILLDGAFLSAKNDDPGAIGNAGQITVEASRLLLTGGGRISVNTDGPGRGGNIVIEEAEEVVLEGIGEDDRGRIIRSAILANTKQGRGGNITITASRLRLTEGAQISVTTMGPGRGGDLTIRAGEIVLETTIRDPRPGLDTLFRPSIVADSAGKAEACGKDCGDGGSITIKADRLQLKDGARISASTLGPGKGGHLSIHAKEVILENGFRRITTEFEEVTESALSARPDGDAEVCDKDCGDGGSITIKAERLQLKQGGAINVATDGSGRGGNITIKADEVVLEGRFDRSVREGGFEAVLSATTRGQGEGSGPGGNITIKAGRLQLKEDAAIRATTWGPGRGGRLRINVGELVVNRGQIVSASGEINDDGKILVGTGDAGRILIDTKDIELRDGGSITTTTIGDGDAGTIRITKAARIELINQGTIASESGLLHPNTRKLIVGKGDAGSVFIDTTDMEIREGGSITTTTRGPGSGGKLSITAADIELRDGASITSESRSGASDAGRSGEIFVKATDSFRLFNDSQISVKTAQADAGDISLDVGFLLHLRDSSITTSVAEGAGSGGDINIDPVFVILDNSEIIANAFGGPGGNVHIVADHFFASPDSVVSASSDLGIDGVVEIDSPDTDLNAGLIELPADFFDAASLLTQGCAPGADLSRLVVRKYEVLPDSPAALRVPPPGGLLSADAPNDGAAFTHEPLGAGFGYPSACGSDG
ncbi:MAG: filamentous hemagglutinin N-terminal domain-containing protein [Gammaproteobacteria bacterium]